MMKTTLWIGVGLIVLGAVVFVAYVVPYLHVAAPVTTAPGGGLIIVTGPSTLAVLGAGFGLAIGAALVGIGFGRWKRRA